MPKRNTDTITAEQKTTKVAPRKMADLKMPATKTDRPEYIKSPELVQFYPFTIYAAQKKGGDYGDRVFFSVAYHNPAGEVVKRIWTPSANDERIAIMREVQRAPVIGCRLVEFPTTGRYDYFKIVDADADVDALIAEAMEEISSVQEQAPSSGADNIPF